MKNQIIDFIKRNRVSSTEIADCLGKQGAIFNANAINKGHFAVGNVFYAYAINGTNWDVHEQIQTVNDGDIVFIEAFDNLDKAIFGDLVSKYLLLYKQASAIVTNGLLRDAPRLIKENWKIWCKGFSPVGYINDKVELSSEQNKIIKKHKEKYQGAIAVCDDTGVVIIPKEYHTKSFLERIEFIEQQEDIWFDCIDRRKYSTFETVCLKKYKSQ
ncbi:RraA family protein [Hydrogenimonas thermophila]|uniref:Regulator of RNase E activity RraA n=1 Tax=Hydrogenimonas thermophila TaxID=223786 RepID=A0A1I5KPJ4_9BACT|nr:RraA family protein [Hydrogenimonas thermophila]SFO86753.1 Regulator of RNase E activity RraA [Hydrogenimonas thermophila]